MERSGLRTAKRFWAGSLAAMLQLSLPSGLQAFAFEPEIRLLYPLRSRSQSDALGALSLDVAMAV